MDWKRTALQTKIRSSHRRYSVRKGVLQNFAIFTRKYLCQSLFFKLKPATLSKKKLRHRCFPVNFAKFWRAPFLRNTSWRMPLKNIFEYRFVALIVNFLLSWYHTLFYRRKCPIIVEVCDHRTNSSCYVQDLKMHEN